MSEPADDVQNTRPASAPISSGEFAVRELIDHDGRSRSDLTHGLADFADIPRQVEWLKTPKQRLAG